MKYSKELHEKWRKREDTSAMFRGNGEEAIILAPELDALLDEIERLQSESRWIPVSERLPETNYPQDRKHYDIVYDVWKTARYVTDAIFNEKRWFEDLGDKCQDITKWVIYWKEKPLPPPEVDE